MVDADSESSRSLFFFFLPTVSPTAEIKDPSDPFWERGRNLREPHTCFFFTARTGSDHGDRGVQRKCAPARSRYGFVALIVERSAALLPLRRWMRDLTSTTRRPQYLRQTWKRGAIKAATITNPVNTTPMNTRGAPEAVNDTWRRSRDDTKLEENARCLRVKSLFCLLKQPSIKRKFAHDRLRSSMRDREIKVEDLLRILSDTFGRENERKIRVPLIYSFYHSDNLPYKGELVNSLWEI